MNRERVFFVGLVAVFLTAYFAPVGRPEFQSAVVDAFRMLQWYARFHTLACVVPALFILPTVRFFRSAAA